MGKQLERTRNKFNPKGKTCNKLGGQGNPFITVFLWEIGKMVIPEKKTKEKNK